MNRKAFAKAIDDEREAWIVELTETAHDALNEQAVLVADAVRERGPGVVAEAVTTSEAIVQELYSDVYTQVFPAIAEILYRTYTGKAFKIGIGDLLDKWLEAARRLILSRPIQRRVKLVQQETIDQINQLVQAGLAEGLSVDRIADLIDGTERGEQVRPSLVGPYTGPPVFDTTVRQRSQRIARTETMAAANAGSRQGVLDTGLDLEHFWIPILDNRTRTTHRAEELQQPRPMNEPFVIQSEKGTVSLMFPSDPHAQGPEPAVAAETIQCRCVEGYEVR